MGKTTDGGETWQPVELPAGAIGQPRRIRFAGRNLGIGVGGGGVIVRTTDGGTSWQSCLSGTQDNLYDVTFAPGGTIWACGTNIILKSMDNGATWTGQTDLPGYSNFALWAIGFRTVLNGWAVGIFGRAIRTTDGGLTWHEFASPIQTSHFGILWLTQSRGIMISPWPIVLTTDGGTTWHETFSCEGASISDVAFADTLNGWVVGGRGTTSLLHTTDGGNTWQKQSLPDPMEWLLAVACTSPTRAWIAGDGGVYKTTNGGITDVKNIGPPLPSEFRLDQNYPNPFNPSTTIGYSLPHRSHVRLAVFNALGQKVADLVNAEIDAGPHAVQLDASNLASGVYFYRLSVSPSGTRDLVPGGARNGQAGSVVQTKSMVLTR